MSSKQKGNKNGRQKDKSSNKRDAEKESTLHTEISQESMAERFEQELIWCVEQLQLGLETQNPDSRQAVEGTKILKILLSSKAPMIKKRQAMRNTFGDYRKKMAEQEKKSAIAAKKMKLSSVQQTGTQKSLFFKKSVSKTTEIQSTVPETETQLGSANSNSEIMKTDSSQTADLNTSFKFNFSINDQSDATNLEKCESGSMDQIENEISEKTNHTAATGCGDVSSSGFTKSDNSFRFNFVSPEET